MQNVQPIQTDETELERPKTRGECKDGPRPCPWVSCRHNTYIEIGKNGQIEYTYKDAEGNPIPVEDLKVSNCSLDYADNGGATLEEVAEVLGMGFRDVSNVTYKILHKPKLQSLKVLGCPVGRSGSNLAQAQDMAMGDGGGSK